MCLLIHDEIGTCFILDLQCTLRSIEVSTIGFTFFFFFKKKNQNRSDLTQPALTLLASLDKLAIMSLYVARILVP